jgi:carbon storage regulator
MLVLTRRVGEVIRIGDDVSICILDIQRGQVRVAIDAPREIPVHREEVYQLVQDENRQAAEAARSADPSALWRKSKEAGKP